MNKLAHHPKGALEREFLMSYRTRLSSGRGLSSVPALVDLPDSMRKQATAVGKRKKSAATVTVTDKGSGKFNINGTGLEEFPGLSQR